jgi:tetratricopeptide (TPR) repeat protein
MEMKCPNCETLISSDAVMCYACGSKIEPNPYNLNEGQLDTLRKAVIAMDNEEWSRAIEHYDDILRERPDISHYWVCRALALAFLDRKDEAWQNLCKAVEVDPENPEPWQARLEFALDEGNHHLKTHMDEYRRRHGRDADALYSLADSMFLLSPKHHMEIRRLCEEALLADPKHKKTRKLLKKLEKKLKKMR